MTDTKHKPHGWVHKEWKEHSEPFVAVYYYPRRSGDQDPVCLVPPALLDAIDEVQEAFQAYFDCVEREDKQEEELLKKKLNKLKEVRG